MIELTEPRVETRHTHGTGCTLSAAIAARLALGDSLEAAVRAAKHYAHAGDSTGAGARQGPRPAPALPGPDLGGRVLRPASIFRPGLHPPSSILR
jgi:sugar/nucleoside kinase (ribokinase family)